MTATSCLSRRAAPETRTALGELVRHAERLLSHRKETNMHNCRLCRLPERDTDWASRLRTCRCGARICIRCEELHECVEPLHAMAEGRRASGEAS